MAFPFLATIASALLSNALSGGGKQPQQGLDFTFPHRTRLPQLPFDIGLRGVNPVAAEPLNQDPILAAMMDSMAPAPYASKEDEQRVKKNANGDQQSFLGKAGDQFMSSLTNNLVQRLIFGGGQQAPQYAPPRFR